MKRNIGFILATGAILATLAVTGTALPAPAFAQAVTDRTLSNVTASKIGSCSTLKVEFNIRIQVISYFPVGSGRELHVRLQPLDPGAAGQLRESLRPPTSLPMLRTIEYEGDNASGPVLSLFFSEDVQFDVEAGQEPDTIIIRLSQPGANCTAEERTAWPAGQDKPQVIGALQPEIAVPGGLYTINMISRPGAIGQLDPAQMDAIAGKIVYEAQFEREGKEWHRLRLGFFESRAEAEKAGAILLPHFPDAWVVRVSPEERAEGVAHRLNTSVEATGSVFMAAATEQETADAAALISQAEAAITEANLDRAIQLLTNALQLPENIHSPRALELLGLTRERKGQVSHALTQYEEYLRRYPNGEAAERVRQRLAALMPVTTGPELRQASGSAVAGGAFTWSARGSFSQFYFRDQSTTKFLDASRPELGAEVDSSVNLNQLLTTADLTISGADERRQLQMRTAGSYTANFRTGGHDIQTLTAAYLDFSDNEFGVNTRIGRQTRNSAGVLGRFDGGLLGVEISPTIKINAVGGFPVLSSRQTNILTDRHFYGAGVDVGNRQSPLQTTVYFFNQQAKGGFTDRRSVGAEARYLKSRFNAFTLADYDIKFKKLNLALATLNLVFPDNSSFGVTTDYRRSPLLTTHNALIGQVESGTFLPILRLEQLRPFFTDAEIYQLALDRTLVVKTATVTYSRPLIEKLQMNLDFSLTDTSGTPATPASIGTEAVAAVPGTGTEYFYGAQLIGTGMVLENDIYILSGRYSDTQRSQTYTSDFNARLPVTSKFRVSPRVRYGYRTDKLIDSTFHQLQPTLRLNYYPRTFAELEIEVGGNFSRQTTTISGATTTTSENGTLINVGYRIDF